MPACPDCKTAMAPIVKTSLVLAFVCAAQVQKPGYQVVTTCGNSAALVEVPR